MRGYFGFGAEGISKPMNMGNLVRSAHAFGAQFVFTVSAHYSVREGKSDTSKCSTFFMPDLQFIKFDQEVSLSGPEVVINPRPVTTTLLIEIEVNYFLLSM